MQALILFTALAFAAMFATYWIGRFRERKLWVTWTHQLYSKWPEHLAQVDLDDLNDETLDDPILSSLKVPALEQIETADQAAS